MSIDLVTNALGGLAVLAVHDHDGPPWPFFVVLAVVLSGIVAVALTRGRRCGPRGRGTAVLAERYARGEIDADEYRARRAELRRR
jgi:putative membrane protein